MWDAEKDDEAAFNVRVDGVVREIGERGKLMVAEAVPPIAQSKVAAVRTRAPAAAAAPAAISEAMTSAMPEPASEAPHTTALSSLHGPAEATTPQRPHATPSEAELTPSMTLHARSHDNQAIASTVAAGGTTTAASLADLSALLEIVQQQAEQADAKLQAQRLVEDKLRAELCDARVEAQRQMSELREQAQKQMSDAQRQMSELREQAQNQVADLEAKRQMLELEIKHTRETEAFARVHALQVRLQTMHGANLLTDEVLFAIEDIIADCADASSDDRVCEMCALSTKMAGDAAFARQLRRRYG